MALTGSNLAPGSRSPLPDPSRALRARLFSGTGLTLAGLVLLLGGLAAIFTFSSSAHAPILLEIAIVVTAGAALFGVGLVRMERAFRAIAAAAHDPSILRRYTAVSWSLWVVGVLCLAGSDFVAAGSATWPARFLQGVGSALILSGILLYWFAHAAETERIRAIASTKSHAP